MKVCIVTNGDLKRPTGVARYWGHVADALAAGGATVRVSLPGKPLAADEVVITAAQLVAPLPKDQPAIAVEHGCAAEHAAREPIWGKAQAGMIKAQQTVAKRPRTFWVACSHWADYYFQKHHGVAADRIIYGAVDTSRFKPGPRQQRRDAAKPVVLHHCADANKGAGALDKVKAACGSAFEFRILRCAQDGVPDAMRDADIWLCLSLSEGLPTVVQEALATDLVLVGTNVGVLDDAEAMARAGASVFDWRKRGDAAFVADQIARAWATRDGASGRDLAMAWALDVFGEKWREALKAAAGRMGV